MSVDAERLACSYITFSVSRVTEDVHSSRIAYFGRLRRVAHGDALLETPERTSRPLGLGVPAFREGGNEVVEVEDAEDERSPSSVMPCYAMMRREVR